MHCFPAVLLGRTKPLVCSHQLEFVLRFLLYALPVAIKRYTCGGGALACEGGLHACVESAMQYDIELALAAL